MTSSSPQTPTRTTGAHPARSEAREHVAARTLAERPPARYEPYLDGLFTYCLSVLCDHDAATAALGDVLALAERRGRHCPESPRDRRTWLYALARWSCLRRLAAAQQKRPGSHATGRAGGPPQPERSCAATPPDDVQEHRRHELTLLAWPEAAGITPEQREALELAVRHHLAPHEVAAVVGREPAATKELLASAACEVERTRAALTAVETGTCPSVAHLTGDSRLVLGSALRRELVRHVDDCPRCRRTAERAIPGRWPGTAVTPAELPVLTAPRAALYAAMRHATRARGHVPRFDRRGFPMDPRDHAARRDRLRTRAVTTTVVATVVAAPVLALWAAYRGTPIGEASGGYSAGVREVPGPDALDGGAGGYENAGNASSTPGGRSGRDGDVSVEVVSVPGRKGAAGLEVSAGHSGDTTLITLTATGPEPVRWSASTRASWLYLSRSSGTLRPGGTLTLKVYVDQLREPSGDWSARVTIAPAGDAVSIEGHGGAPGTTGPGPAPAPSGTSGPPPGAPDPAPADPAPSEPAPGEPSDPASSGPQDPAPGEPSPSSPDAASPPPNGSGDPSGTTP
ncbi:hypothetical protein ABZ354_14535 [Streptomyces sp. NPDC005925]|uniref:BACON domain-containing protein n=1 Tax=Streptomyces sp. NPDC005925 TaxID=3157172 RepID=UPI0033F65FFC